MHDLVVIGAGIMGAAVAYRASRAGLRVTVCESERPAALASRRSFAWINAFNKPPQAYHRLNAAGVAAHHRWAGELGGDWLHRTGNLVWVTGVSAGQSLEDNVECLTRWGYPVRRVERAEVARLAPWLNLTDESAAAFALAPEEGWVEVVPLVARLLAATTALGGSVRWPAPVRRVTPAADRIRVELADGDMLVADWVVDCAGCAAGEVLAEQQLGLLCRDSPGLLVVTEPAATSLDRVVHTPGVYMRPEGNGRVLIGSNEIDASLADLPRGAPEPGPYAAPARELLGRAQARLPDLAGVDVESVRLCWRPMPGDDLSAVGPLAAVPGYYLALTHSGVTLAPILAESIVAEMTTGEADPLLQAFRPDRLLQRL